MQEVALAAQHWQPQQSSAEVVEELVAAGQAETAAVTQVALAFVVNPAGLGWAGRERWRQ